MSTAERRRREREQRREAIISAAELVFYDRGYTDARMDDIAARAQLSKGALYQYFKSKEDLLLAVTLRWRGLLLDAFTAELSQRRSGIAQVRALLRRTMEFLTDHPERVRLMLQVMAGGPFEPDRDSETFSATRERGMRLFERMAEAVEQGKQDGTLRRDLDPMMLFLHLWGSAIGVAIEVQFARIDPETEIIERELGFSLDSILPSFVDFFTDALRPRAAGGGHE
ncbi:MAG: TetR/AcrR family transcriptional regulator [Myxococcales bacterium]|nr:TetR/AcrR family transcriptional regulator [Myxococcales bacterium]